MKSLQNFEYIYLLFYILWGWIYKYTIYASSIGIYVSFIFLAVVSFYKIFKYGKNILRVDSLALLWCPFVFYIWGAFIFDSSFENVSYWLVVIALLLISNKEKLTSKIPVSFILFSGLFMLTGILIQFFFSDFYVANIKPLIVYDQLDAWIEWSVGYNGFAYQLAISAIILIYSEFVLLYLAPQTEWFKNKHYLLHILVALVIIGVFMTGKKMHSSLAILIPCIIMCITQGKQYKKILYVVASISFVVALSFYVYENADSLVDSPVFGRFAKTIVGAENGDSIASGRDVLWQYAYDLFVQNPILGAGIGAFNKAYGIETHNTFLQCLCELGIVGFILFMIPLVSSLFYTIYLYKRSTSSNVKGYLLFSLSIQIFYISYCLTGNTLYDIICFITYFISISLLIECKQKIIC